jgi:hypothetical protein
MDSENSFQAPFVVHHVLVAHLPELAAQVIELAAVRVDVDVVEVEGRTGRGSSRHHKNGRPQ